MMLQGSSSLAGNLDSDCFVISRVNESFYGCWLPESHRCARVQPDKFSEVFL